MRKPRRTEDRMDEASAPPLSHPVGGVNFLV